VSARVALHYLAREIRCQGLNGLANLVAWWAEIIEGDPAWVARDAADFDVRVRPFVAGGPREKVTSHASAVVIDLALRRLAWREVERIAGPRSPVRAMFESGVLLRCEPPARGQA
jgi:hypothetical protein